MNNEMMVYEDRSAVMSAAARAEEFKKMAEVYGRFVEGAKSVDGGAKLAVNAGREVGLLLASVLQDRLLDKTFFRDHCREHCEFDFSGAKMFLGMAKNIPAPVKSLAEAIPYLQQILTEQGYLALAQREGPQTRCTVSVIEKFLKEVTIVRTDFKKALRHSPMENWAEADLTAFLADTEWLVQERARAAKLTGAVIEA